MSVLLTACSAVLTGVKSFAAIGQWARKAPQDTLVRLGARTATVFGVRIAPSAATILALDGKSARGSRTDDSPAAHLLDTFTETANELHGTRGGGLNLIFRAARELRPWRSEPTVQEAQDQLMALMEAV